MILPACSAIERPTEKKKTTNITLKQRNNKQTYIIFYPISATLSSREYQVCNDDESNKLLFVSLCAVCKTKVSPKHKTEFHIV